MKFTKIVSDRHFGIGSDGLIMINPSKVADFEMEMYNADGSRGEMCGNGIRCVAKYVYDYGLTDKTHISVETLGGIKYLDLTVKDGKVALVRVDMSTLMMYRDLTLKKSDRNSRTMRDFHSGLIQNSQELSIERPWKCVCGREDPARHLHVEPEHVL